MLKYILSVAFFLGCCGTLSGQTKQPLRELPYKAQIGNRTDSITVKEILAAGKVTCTHPALTVVSFKFGHGGDGALDCYSECFNPSDTFSDITLSAIRRLNGRQRIYIDSVLVKNKNGMYYIKPTKYKIYSAVIQ